MENTELVGNEWQYILDMMPSDLEETAHAKLAIERRREIWDAADLLRLALAYGVCDLTLRETSVWAAMAGIGELSDVAVMNRLRRAADWLGYLVVRWLQDHEFGAAVPQWPVRIVDATVICKPGSKGTDWRLHLGLDLAQQRIISAELTGPEGGETFRRHQVPAGQIVLGDRGYAQRAGVAHLLQQQAHVVVRLNWQNFPLQTRAGRPLDLLTCLELVSAGEIGDWPVQFEHEKRSYAMRLIAIRKTAIAAEKEQKQICHEARAKGRKPDPRSLRAAHFIFVLTDLLAESLGPGEALELYRLRWQIEIAFKRLKGLLHLDHLRAKDQRLAMAYLYAKLLGALLLDQLHQRAESFFPWGFPLLRPTTEPLATRQGTAWPALQ